MEYKGTINAWTAEGFVGNGTPDTLDPAGRWETRIQWDAVATLTPGVTPIWQFKTLAGTASLTSPIAPGAPCSATFTANPAYQLPVNVSTLAGGAQQVSQRIADVASVSYSPTQAGALLPSAKCVPDAERSARDAFPIDYAANNFQAFAPTQFAALQQAETVTAQFQPGGTTTATSSFNQPALMRPSITGPTDGLTITQSITVTAGQCPSPIAAASTGAPLAAAAPVTACQCPLKIIDSRSGKVAGTHVTAAIGEDVRLEAVAQCAGYPAAPASGPQWVVAGNPVSAYDVKAAQTTAPTVLTNLTTDTLEPHWLKPGSYTVSVTASGAATPAATTVDVAAPSVKLVQATCNFGIRSIFRTVGKKRHVVFVSMSYGQTDACPNRPGISNSWSVTPPTSGPPDGQVEVVQLLTDVVTHNGKTCGRNVTTPSLDVSLPYLGVEAALAGGTVTLPEQIDTPNLPLFDKDLKVNPFIGLTGREFHANTYLFYMPSGTGSLWAPLARVDWGFKGTVRYEGNLKIFGDLLPLVSVLPGGRNFTPRTTDLPDPPTWNAIAVNGPLGCPG